MRSLPAAATGLLLLLLLGPSFRPGRPGFESGGIRLQARGDGVDLEGRGWTLRLSGSALGRSGETPLGRRAFREWYVPADGGIEQGFDLRTRPDGEGPLVLTQRVSGGLRPSLRDPGRLDFVDATGRPRLGYGELRVLDARGRPLPAALRAEAGLLGIEIDDRGARYPLTVDPVLKETASWAFEPDQASANAGIGVACGDVNGDGYSDLVVGASQHDNGETNEGRAWVFHGSGDGISTTAAWTAEGNQGTAYFGLSVAAADLNGDGFSDLLVMAPRYDNGHTDEGRVYAFHGSAAGLSTTAAWTAESQQTSAAVAFFEGFANVAGGGDVNADGFSEAAVSFGTYDNAEASEGRVHLYHGSAAGLSTTVAWTREGDQTGAFYGAASVGSAGDVNGDGFSDLLVPAIGYDNGESDEGRLYVFHGSAAGLSTTVAWTVESHWPSGASFGSSIPATVAARAGDLNGDGFSDVIVSYGFYDNGQTDEGRAYAYLGSAAGLSTAASWSFEADQSTAWMGYSVSGSSAGSAGDLNKDGYSDVFLATRQYDNGQGDEGRVWAFLGGPSGLSTTAAWTREGNLASGSFGASVASGDFNRDGFSDLLVGASAFTNAQASEGRAYAYLSDPMLGEKGERQAAGGNALVVLTGGCFLSSARR